MRAHSRRLARVKLPVVRKPKPETIVVTYNVEEEAVAMVPNHAYTDYFEFIEVPINSWANQLAFI